MEILRAQPRRTNADGTLRDHVFGKRPGKGYQDWSVDKARLDARLGDRVEPWTLHDLRRSLSTSLHDRFGVQPHIVERILNHALPRVHGTYNKSVYAIEVRDAMLRWSTHIAEIVEGRERKVVAFERAAVASTP